MERFEELCAGYVLKALEAGEREEFEQMLESASPEELELYHEMNSAANQLAFSMEPQEASKEVKKRIMAQIGDSKNEDKAENVEEEDDAAGPATIDGQNTTVDWGKFAIAASFALLLVTLSLVFYSFNLSGELNQREQVIEQQQARITALRQEVAQKEELLAILESREVDLVIMNGLEVNPGGYGKVIWDQESQRALLQVSNLPSVPSDKDYQLWIIKNNKPVSAGVFAVNDPSRDNFFKIEELAEDAQPADAFAITMEPKGGMPQPTGDMYLLGSINGGS
jgi:anti-sigma-K factor RskA